MIQCLAAIAFAGAAISAHATPSTAYYIYDESGHVIGEYDQNGNPVQEHVYLGDRPVAVVQNNTTLDYVTTDQLNTPRAITDSSKTIQWSWASDPFGNGQPTGSLTYNLRFPGQYYDAETGHSYNYWRDYDSGTGRYIESDPSGLKAGMNTYAYVGGDPLYFADPKGLGPCPAGSLPGCDAMYENSGENNSACATAECAAGIPPNPVYTREQNCEFECNIVLGAICKPFVAKMPSFWGKVAAYASCEIPIYFVCAKVCKDPNNCPLNNSANAGSPPPARKNE